MFTAATKGNTPEIFSLRPDYPGATARGLPGVHLLSISSKGELAVLTRARYIGHNLFDGTLARMPLEGAAPREILEGVREADWSPDGSDLAIIRDVNGKDRLEFPVGKVLCEASGYLSDLRFSPKGDRIAFFEHPIKYDDRGLVAVVDLVGQEDRSFRGLLGGRGPRLVAGRKRGALLRRHRLQQLQDLRRDALRAPTGRVRQRRGPDDPRRGRRTAGGSPRGTTSSGRCSSSRPARRTSRNSRGSTSPSRSRSPRTERRSSSPRRADPSASTTRCACAERTVRPSCGSERAGLRTCRPTASGRSPSCRRRPSSSSSIPPARERSAGSSRAASSATTRRSSSRTDGASSSAAPRPDARCAVTSRRSRGASRVR